eukprot:GFYU01021642.1.p1 GENE.GFYU01021642.1~~GFYU01021642.1.p1  ORF type:complete len:226 (+),score=54.63 GFYU01021642.1:60-737(+)
MTTVTSTTLQARVLMTPLRWAIFEVVSAEEAAEADDVRDVTNIADAEHLQHRPIASVIGTTLYVRYLMSVDFRNTTLLGARLRDLNVDALSMSYSAKRERLMEENRDIDPSRTTEDQVKKWFENHVRVRDLLDGDDGDDSVTREWLNYYTNPIRFNEFPSRALISPIHRWLGADVTSTMWLERFSMDPDTRDLIPLSRIESQNKTLKEGKAEVRTAMETPWRLPQ